MPTILEGQVKQISLDSEDERIQDFVRSLSVGPEGSVLVIDGRPVLQVHPVVSELVDAEKLKAAIFERWRQSRDLNAEWDSVDPAPPGHQ